MQINKVQNNSFKGVSYKKVTGADMKNFLSPILPKLEKLGEKCDLVVQSKNVGELSIPVIEFVAKAFKPQKWHFFRKSAKTQYLTIRSEVIGQMYSSPLEAAERAVQKCLMLPF